MSNYLLRRSYEEKMKLDIVYLDQQQEMTQRVVRVVRLEEDYFLAFCFTRKKVRKFHKNNLLAVYPYQRQRKGERFFDAPGSR
ncbi:hypothetical protein [Halalkalibacillus halophilus]|uniref:hypothetical protein n=1 Tax=Halalkalibacillus halophilus TaxID=392827 RepID=UPI00040FFC54|nr:hypothetical protein [Halalkalibacillus halophilus]